MAPPRHPAKANETQETKGQTLRLNKAAWRELKVLAIDRGQPAHDLLIEAVNDLFKKYQRKARA